MSRKKEKGVYAFTPDALKELTSPAGRRGGAAKKAANTARVKKEKPRFSMPSLTKPGARLQIKGAGQTRLLNELRAAGVACRDVERVSGFETVLTTPEKDVSKAFAILEKLCYNYTVLARVSARSWLSALLKKSALLASTAILAAVCAYAYRFVWRVEITGCQKLESAAVERFLQDNGYGAGAVKASLDPVKIRSLVNSLDDVLETSVQVSGVTLQIEVTETTDHTVPNPPSDAGIFSRYDAEVMRIVAESGTAAVMRGQRVFKGAELIGAYRTDQNGLKVPAPAKGRVYGTVTFVNSYRIALSETVRSRTGKTAKKTDYVFFGLNMPGKVKHNFALAESETRESYVFENFFIPLKMRQTVYYELTESVVAYDLAERTQYYTQATIAAHAAAVGSGGYTVKTALEQTGAESYILHTFLQTEMLIGEN